MVKKKIIKYELLKYENVSLLDILELLSLGKFYSGNSEIPLFYRSAFWLNTSA